jgi:hypothetical protein
MTNDETPNDERNPNDQEENAGFDACRRPPAFRHSDFVILSTFVIRHSSFTANVAESRSVI